MKFGLDIANMGENLSNPHNLILLAKEAEKSGWDGFFLWNTFLSDDSHYISNPIVTISAIAAQTTKIKLGFLIIPLPFYKPWQIASEMVTLDHLSKGRMILGVGSGGNSKDFSSFNEADDLKIRGEKLDESLEIITGLWSGKPFSYSGKHYQIKNVQLQPACFQTPRVPIWVAGFWPNKKPFRRASKYDGVYPGSDDNQLTPEVVQDILQYINTNRKNSETFDSLIWVDLPEEKSKIKEMVELYEKAGLTWMNIPRNSFKLPFHDLLNLVKQGPPQI